MSDEILITVCPNGCSGELKQTKIVVAEGALRECPSCGQLVSSCGRERYQLSSQDWDTEDGTWPSEKNLKRMMHRKKRDLRVIRKLLNQDGKYHLLDVGCSNGAFISYANSLGLHAEGVDPSDKAVKNGIERGIKIHSGYLHEVGFSDDSFDAITLYEVIEHVDAPSDLLKECHRILRPGGILVIGTGNIDSWTRWARREHWDFFDMNMHGGHISFFSPNSLGILASRTGFTVSSVRTSSVKFFEKGDIPMLLYRLVKILTEMLNIPARYFCKGHQMEVYLMSDRKD